MSGTLVDHSLVAQPAIAQCAAGTGLLRQAVPDQDAASIRDFVCGLSPRSQYLRFFAAVAPPSTGLLRALCGAAGTRGAPGVVTRDCRSGAPGVATRDCTVDVLLVLDGGGRVIAHGMAADEPAAAGLATSIGLVVGDAHQRQGIGRLLLNALVGRAASRGVRSLIFEVLPANRVMLGIIGRRWPDAPAQRTPDAIVFRPPIAPRAGAGLPVPSVVHIGPYRPPGEERARPAHAA